MSAHAAEVKSLESALTVRGRILAAFEAAELERDRRRRAEWLTFAVVGAGPTGVEISGFLAWITWLVVHLFYLVGFQNRLLVFIRWCIGFATRGRGTRLITRVASAEAAERPCAHPQPQMR